MLGEFKLAHIGGVTRQNMKLFRTIEKRLTLSGYICFAPVIYDYKVWLPNQKMLDDMCYEKLKICDLFVVATPWHVGKSTSLRISQAKEMNIPVVVYNFSEKYLEIYDDTKDYNTFEYLGTEKDLDEF